MKKGLKGGWTWDEGGGDAHTIVTRSPPKKNQTQYKRNREEHPAGVGVRVPHRGHLGRGGAMDVVRFGCGGMTVTGLCK